MRYAFFLLLLTAPALAVQLDAQGHPVGTALVQPAPPVPNRPVSAIRPVMRSCDYLRNRYLLLEQRLHSPEWTKQDFFEAQDLWAGMQAQNCR